MVVELSGHGPGIQVIIRHTADPDTNRDCYKIRYADFFKFPNGVADEDDDKYKDNITDIHPQQYAITVSIAFRDRDEVCDNDRDEYRNPD
jgi:hypothetical protein